MQVVLTFDSHEWDALLKAWQEPPVKRTLKAAASAFGRAAKPVIQAEIPMARPGNKYAVRAGNLRASTRSRQIKSGIGVVVGPMGRTAFYREWVARGTKPHEIRAKAGTMRIGSGFARVVHHPGSKPNDFIGRASGRAEREGYAKAEAVIFDGLDARRISEAIDT